MKNTARKGQMEIMGLIVIIVLITLGLFFVIAFKINKPKQEIKQTFEDEQISSKFIISFLKTNSGCQKQTMEGLVQDCAVERRFTCDGLDSCSFVNRTAQAFINQTLKKWNKKYNFTIENLPVNITFYDGCTSRQNRDSSRQPITLYPYPGTVTVKADICK